VELRPIEKKLKELLREHSEITESREEELFSYYITARKRLIDEILDEIKAVEKDLTDHSSKHISNVLDNAYRLIGDDWSQLNCMELYLLCTIILFHDVGNIHGREGHYDRRVISKIYGYVRGDDPKFDGEKSQVAETASTHSGQASDGSTDTIKEIRPYKVQLHNTGINISLRKIAALLRFADELAEGLQRTSNFMLLNHGYNQTNEKYHQFAKQTEVHIDKNGHRIALTYRIKLRTYNGIITKEEKDKTTEQLEYIYHRIVKLNQERRYNRYYCDLLTDFKRTSVRIEFEVDGLPHELGLQELTINDLHLPGESHKSISEIDSAYEIQNIIAKLCELE
jgi:hypothetical protein